MKWPSFKLSEQEKQVLKEAGKNKPFKSFQKEAMIYLILSALALIFLWEHPNILILFIVAMATVIGTRYSRALKSSKATYSIGEKVEKEINRQQELTKKVALPIIFAIVGVFVMIMAGLIIYVLYLKPHLPYKPIFLPLEQEEKSVESVEEEITDISIKSRSSGYVWYQSDKVEVFLYAPNETKSMVSDKNKSCEMPTLGATVFEGDYKLILDPSTATVDSYGEASGIVWKPAVFELGKLKFVEGTLWDGKLATDSMGWYDSRDQTNLLTNLIMVYQYGNCNIIQIKMYGYTIRNLEEETRFFVQYRFKHKDGSIKDVLEASLGDVGRPLDIRIGHTDTPYVPGFTSWRYDNSLGKIVYTSWNFNSEQNLFIED